MTSRAPLRHRSRSLYRRLEALEQRREQLSTPPAVRGLDPSLLPLELLKKLESVYEWVKANGTNVLAEEQQAIVAEVSAFYEIGRASCRERV